MTDETNNIPQDETNQPVADQPSQADDLQETELPGDQPELEPDSAEVTALDETAETLAAETAEESDAPAEEVADESAETPAHLLESAEPDMTPEEMAAIVEAILFATDNPLTLARIAKVAELPQKYVKEAIATLNRCYEEIGASFRIENIAGGFQMMTLPEYNDILRRLFKAKKESRLGNAAMETLAIIAYRQPVIRADIEAIRGVSCGEVLRGLMERGLIKVVGRADVIGRPMLYGTTRKFLEIFGLASLKDLPKVDELKTPAPARKAPKPDEEAAPESDASEEVAPEQNATADAEIAESSQAPVQAEAETGEVESDEAAGVYVEDEVEDSAEKTSEETSEQAEPCLVEESPVSEDQSADATEPAES